MAINIFSNSGKVSYNIKELVADQFADLPLDDIAVGSTAFVIDDKKNYMFNSLGEWVEVALGGGSGGGLTPEVLKEGEYDSETGKPTILDPQEGVIYFSPNETQWIYAGEEWVKVGSTIVDLSEYVRYSKRAGGEIDLRDSRADMAETDEDAPSYIRNNPFEIKIQHALNPEDEYTVYSTIPLSEEDLNIIRNSNYIEFKVNGKEYKLNAIKSEWDDTWYSYGNEDWDFTICPVFVFAYYENFGWEIQYYDDILTFDKFVFEYIKIDNYNFSLPAFRNLISRTGLSIGENTTASGQLACAEGYNTEARGDFSHAEGDGSLSIANFSHAEGQFTKAEGYASHAEGSHTYTTIKSYNSHTEGRYTIASGSNCHAEGGGSSAEGWFATITKVLNNKSFVINEKDFFEELIKGKSYFETNKKVYIINNYNKENSTIEVSDTSGLYDGLYIYIIGLGCTQSSGYSSHAEGFGTTSSNTGSHAEGFGTTSSNTGSHAEGDYTQAIGGSSHAEGTRTIAKGLRQHVQGIYNIEDNSSAHIVGNGTGSKHSNCHTLDWLGNAWYSGDIYVGSTSGTNRDEGSKKVVVNGDSSITIGNTTITEAQLQQLLGLLGG